MQSRTIAILSFSILVVLITIGGAALAAVMDAQYERKVQSGMEVTAGARVETRESRPDSTQGPADQPLPAKTSEMHTQDPAGMPGADDSAFGFQLKLESNFKKMWTNFEPGSAEVNADMIPHLAEIIALMNQPEAGSFRLVLQLPDRQLAEARVRMLRDLFNRNLIVVEKLEIESETGESAFRLSPRNP